MKATCFAPPCSRKYVCFDAWEIVLESVRRIAFLSDERKVKAAADAAETAHVKCRHNPPAIFPRKCSPAFPDLFWMVAASYNACP